MSHSVKQRASLVLTKRNAASGNEIEYAYEYVSCTDKKGAKY